MKQVLTAIAIVGLLTFSSAVNAQVKIGYINVDNVIALMPETAKLDSLLERYQTDSINPQYA